MVKAFQLLMLQHDLNASHDFLKGKEVLFFAEKATFSPSHPPLSSPSFTSVSFAMWYCFVFHESQSRYDFWMGDNAPCCAMANVVYVYSNCRAFTFYFIFINSIRLFCINLYALHIHFYFIPSGSGGICWFASPIISES